MYLLFWFRTMKTPIVLYQRCMAKISYFRLIRFFLLGTVVTENHSIDPQRTGTNQGIDIIYGTVLSAGLRLSTLIWRRNNRFFIIFFIWKSHVIGQCHFHWHIPADILSHFNKIVKQYNRVDFRLFEPPQGIEI